MNEQLLPSASDQEDSQIHDDEAKELSPVETVVMCADCHYWDGHDDSMGICTRLPDGRYVQVPIDDHVQLRLMTSDDFGCSLGAL